MNPTNGNGSFVLKVDRKAAIQNSVAKRCLVTIRLGGDLAMLAAWAVAKTEETSLLHNKY